MTDLDLARLAQAAYLPRPPDGIVFDAGEDRAVLTRSREGCVLAVRGTANLAGWWSDFQIGRGTIREHAAWGPCEAGFLAGAEALLGVLAGRVSADVPLWLVGHSRGAGMLPILALSLFAVGIHPARCVALESPWSVGPVAKAAIEAAGIGGVTYWHGNDPVPDVPAESWLTPWVWPVRRVGRPKLLAIECHYLAGVIECLEAEAAAA